MALDVLFAGLQRQHKAALAVPVDGLADDAPRHVADIALLGGDEAEGGAAEGERVAQALAVADGDIRSRSRRGTSACRGEIG